MIYFHFQHMSNSFFWKFFWKKISQLQFVENIGISHQQFVEYIGLKKIFGKKISHLQFVEYIEVLHKLQLAKKFEIF